MKKVCLIILAFSSMANAFEWFREKPRYRKGYEYPRYSRGYENPKYRSRSGYGYENPSYTADQGYESPRYHRGRRNRRGRKRRGYERSRYGDEYPYYSN